MRFDEPLAIKANMNITCHPSFVTKGIFNTICDNYLIGDKGVTERLHRLPETLIELG